VCDDDIDIRDPFMRDWVMAWRVRPDKDMRVLPGTAMVELDPSSLEPGLAMHETTGAKVMIDATQKWEYPGISLPPRDMMEKVAGEWEAYGLPALGELRVPRRT
jgi:4-hydroxy-3-polyprenylbenzoate decarboxylase